MGYKKYRRNFNFASKLFANEIAYTAIVRVVFALDEEIDVRRDENIKKLKRFVKVEFVKI